MMMARRPGGNPPDGKRGDEKEKWRGRRYVLDLFLCPGGAGVSPAKKVGQIETTVESCVKNRAQ